MFSKLQIHHKLTSRPNLDIISPPFSIKNTPNLTPSAKYSEN